MVFRTLFSFTENSLGVWRCAFVEERTPFKVQHNMYYVWIGSVHTHIGNIKFIKNGDCFLLRVFFFLLGGGGGGELENWVALPFEKASCGRSCAY